LDQFLDTFWSTFGPILGSLFGTKWAQEGPRWALRGLLRASKSQKHAFAKTLKTLQFFMVFELPRPSKRRLKRSKGFKKVDPKMEPILATFWTNFGALLGPIFELKSAPEGNQKWDHFWDP
jgi:hypothetical protein